MDLAYKLLIQSDNKKHGLDVFFNSSPHIFQPGNLEEILKNKLKKLIEKRR